MSYGCSTRWNEPSTTPPTNDMGYNGPHQCSRPGPHPDEHHRCCCGATLKDDK